MSENETHCRKCGRPYTKDNKKVPDRNNCRMCKRQQDKDQRNRNSASCRELYSRGITVSHKPLKGTQWYSEQEQRIEAHIARVQAARATITAEEYL